MPNLTSAAVKIFIALDPCDLRTSPHGLHALASDQLQAAKPAMPSSSSPTSDATASSSTTSTAPVTDKYHDHLPHHHQSKRFRQEHGADIVRQTLNTLTHATARHLAPVDRAIRAELLLAYQLEIDETSIAYQDPGNGSVREGRSWPYRDPVARTSYPDWQTGRGVCLPCSAIDAGVAGWVKPKDTADFLKLGNRMDSLLETFDRVTWVGGIPYVRSFHAESTKLVDVGGGIVAQIKAKADSVTIRDTIGVSPGISRALELMVNAGRIEEARAAIESILEPLGKKYESIFRGPRASAKVTSAVPHIQ